MTEETLTPEQEAKKKLEGIKRKIAAMLETTGKTEAEEAASTALALKLAAKYNLDLAEAAGWKPGTYTTLDICVGRTRWRRELLAIICKYTFCKAYYRKAEGTNFIVGEPHNQELVEMMTRTLIKHIEPLAQQAYISAMAKRQASGLGKIHAKSWKDTFFNGANSAIADRLHRLELQQTEYRKDLPESFFEDIRVPDAQPDNSDVTITDSDVPAYRALIVTKQDALVEACKKLVPVEGKGIRTKKYKWDAEAYHMGHSAGKDAPLTTYKQIGAAK